MKKYIWGLILALLLTGCGNNRKNGFVDNGNITPMPTKVQQTTASKDEEKVLGGNLCAVLLKVNPEEKKVLLRQIEEGTEYELTYTGATDVRNEYNEVVLMQQLEVGSIVDATFDRKELRLGALKTSSKAFRSKNIINFHADITNDMITFGSGNYRYDEFLSVLSEGEPIDASQVMKKDKVTVWGIGNKIYSVVVNEGHGYVKFIGYEQFIGGMVEIGRSYLYKVTDNMMLTIPEGQYKITMSKGNLTGSKTIQVVRDMQAIIDFSEFRPEVLKTGTIRFQIEPENATLYINNKKTDFEETVDLDYGKYSIRVTCPNYVEYTENLVVDQIYTTKEIVLELVKEKETKESQVATQESTVERATNEITDLPQETTRTVPKETMAEGTGKGNLIIEAPIGVDVYIDAIFSGQTPLTIKKNPGEHIITFYKSGYETKSYAIDVSSEDADQKLSFPEMNEE